MPEGPRPDPPPFTMHLQVQSSYDGFFWETGFWIKVDTADMPAYPLLVSFGEDVGNLFVSDFYPFLNVLNTLVAVQGVMFGNDPEALDFTSFVAGTGGNADDSEAAQVAAVLSWPIARHHRGGHPRNYIGGLSDTDLANVAQLTSSCMSDIAAAGATFRNDVNGLHLDSNTVQIGVVSFQNNREWRAEGVFFPYLGDPVVRPTLGTQRRRLTG